MIIANKSISMKHYFICLLFLGLSLSGFSQRGKDSVKTISASPVIVNEYTHLTADAAAGATTLKVSASGLNANARFKGTLAAGDLILIYQAQGAKLNGVNAGVFGSPNDSSWGAVTNYLNCGLYEFQEVNSVPNATTINLDCALTNSYSDTGMVQVVRVPRYRTLTINAGAKVTAQAWNGVTGEGGILAVEVLGNTIINGAMDVTGLGFRGGKLLDNNSAYGGGYFAAMNSGEGEDKGEGIAGYETKYDQYGGHRCPGAAANAGGGGRAHNGGGGGGSNAGILSGVGSWDGKGIPDCSTANFIQAWNLEVPKLANHNSSGGGRGGYSFASSGTQNPLTLAPSYWNALNTAWGGDYRRVAGGLGGRPLDYTTGRLFLGGGGGAGDQDNSYGGAGGTGGGIIYFMSYGTISGTTGTMNANGNNGASTPTNTIFNNASDGAGGAGGGGVIVVNSVGPVSGFNASANGGIGGNQVVINSTSESEGPGGGGGGGYIAISLPSTAGQKANGGANGTTNSPGMNQAGKAFPPNGATAGANGLINQGITSFTIAAKTDTVCAGSTATLNATLNGTVPAGTSILWYAAAAGGASIGSGPSFTTPVINGTTVFYAGTCPGTYRLADTVKVLAAPVANAGPNTSVCGGGSVTLTGSGGGTYSWTPSTGLSSTTTAVTQASPAGNMTYTLTVANAAGCTNSATVTVTVGPGLVASASASQTTICQGKTTTLNATGGTTYSWSPATGLSASNIANPIATPASPITYTVTAGNGSCTGTATVSIAVNPRPIASAGPDVSECAGSGALLNASGGGSYSWSPATGLSSTIIASPTVTTNTPTTYTVTVVDGNGCRDSSTVNLLVNPKPIVHAGTAVQVCTGGNINLQATGATTYSWSPPTGLSNTNTSNPNAAPVSTTTYTVTGTDAKGCVNTDTVTVGVGGSMTLVVTNNTTVCQGIPTPLSASGATTYSWSPATGLTATNISNPTATPSATTTYTVTGNNGSGCTGSNTVTITIDTLPVAHAGSNVATCAGTPVNLTGSGGGTYSWTPSTGLSSTNTAATSANPPGTATYTLTVTNSFNCSATATVAVAVNALPVVTITGPASVCAGSGVTLTANGASSYSWSPSTGLSSTVIGNPTASPAANTTYTVTGTDANNCVGSATTSLAFHNNPKLSLSSNVISGCVPVCVNLTGIDSTGTCSTVLMVYGDGGTGSSASAQHCYQSSGNYSPSFTCTDGNGCTATVTKTNFISVLAKPQASFTASGGPVFEYSGSKPDSVCFNNTSTLSTTWSWDFGNLTSSALQQPPCVAYTDSGTYCVHLLTTSAAGCRDSATVCVQLIKRAEVTYTIPNVFSPNGDGINDLFLIKNTGLKTLNCEIYDRWGRKLYEFNSLTGSWDGASSGKKVSDGTYYYLVTMQTLGGETKKEKGFVELMTNH
jgi:gliding motility-associated-like protein